MRVSSVEERSRNPEEQGGSMTTLLGPDEGQMPYAETDSRGALIQLSSIRRHPHLKAKWNLSMCVNNRTYTGYHIAAPALPITHVATHGYFPSRATSSV